MVVWIVARTSSRIVGEKRDCCSMYHSRSDRYGKGRWKGRAGARFLCRMSKCCCDATNAVVVAGVNEAWV